MATPSKHRSGAAAAKTSSANGPAAADDERRAVARALVLQGLTAAKGGRLEDAVRVWKQYLDAHADDGDAPAVRDGIAAAERLLRALEGLHGE